MNAGIQQSELALRRICRIRSGGIALRDDPPVRHRRLPACNRFFFLRSQVIDWALSDKILVIEL